MKFMLSLWKSIKTILTSPEMFKKAYIEITNNCNLNCGFCHGTKRQPSFMLPSDFYYVANELRRYTQYIYLHVLGEPLLHPNFDDILAICAELDFNICITTNGFLVPEQTAALCKYPVYKLSLSLHSFEANPDIKTFDEYMCSVAGIGSVLSKKGTIIAYRLWNNGGENTMNESIKEYLYNIFTDEKTPTARGVRLAKNIFIEDADVFGWPDMNAEETDTEFCMALRDQIAILCDGTVVPCCLDAEGDIPLGNIFTSSLADILSSVRAKTLYDGFTNHNPSEALCRRCAFAAERFKRRN